MVKSQKSRTFPFPSLFWENGWLKKFASCFSKPRWSLEHLGDTNYLKIPGRTGTGSLQTFIGVPWKGQAREKLKVKEIWDCYSNLQRFHSSVYVLLNLVFFLGQCHCFCSLTLWAWQRWAVCQPTVFPGAPKAERKYHTVTEDCVRLPGHSPVTVTRPSMYLREEESYARSCIAWDAAAYHLPIYSAHLVMCSYEFFSCFEDLKLNDNLFSWLEAEPHLV